jgi:DNA-directed RNA polymerase specialized sigma24 family protein
MEGSPADKVKKVLDRYPTPTFWDELFGPLRNFLVAKVRQHFLMFSEDDALEATQETICRISQHCDFESLSVLPEDARNKKFFKFVNTTLYNSAVDIIRQRDGRYRPEPNLLAKRLKRPASQLIWQAFGELDEAEQSVICLKDMDGLTYEQISAYYDEELGLEVSAEALKKRRLRALAQLVRKLKVLVNEGA